MPTRVIVLRLIRRQPLVAVLKCNADVVHNRLLVLARAPRHHQPSHETARLPVDLRDDERFVFLATTKVNNSSTSTTVSSSTAGRGSGAFWALWAAALTQLATL